MKRVIKKYSNRKLYDTEASKMITISELSNYVKDGIDFMVIDNETGDDITDLTLVQILMEIVKDRKEFSSAPYILREIIKSGKSAVIEFIKNSLIASINAISLTEQKAKEIVRTLIDKKKISEKEAEVLKNLLIESAREREKILEEKIRSVLDEALKKIGITSKRELKDYLKNNIKEILTEFGVSERKIKEISDIKEDLLEIKRDLKEILKRLK
ncbi:MAG: polyhydroxyalkanoate synthesis regulator DNA-binding domain-containing protein [Candidatus Hydrothermales bacterium]